MFTEFRAAVKAGDYTVVQKCLQKNPRLAVEIDEIGQVALQDAADALIDNVSEDLNGLSGVVQALLESRADPNARSPVAQGTPLQSVLQSRNMHLATKLAGSLLKGRADPNRQDELGDGPLTEAVLAGNLAACQLLLQHGASPKLLNGTGQSAVDLAVEMEENNASGVQIRQALEEVEFENMLKDIATRKKSIDDPETSRRNGQKADGQLPREEETAPESIPEVQIAISASNDRGAGYPAPADNVEERPSGKQSTVSHTVVPTMLVGSRYVFAESAADIRVILPLGALFGGRDLTESELDVEAKPLARHLEVRISGPGVLVDVPKVCWVLATPLSKEVIPEDVSWELNSGQLIVILPKASLDRPSVRPERKLPEWCRKDGRPGENHAANTSITFAAGMAREGQLHPPTGNPKLSKSQDALESPAPLVSSDASSSESKFLAGSSRQLAAALKDGKVGEDQLGLDTEDWTQPPPLPISSSGKRKPPYNRVRCRCAELGRPHESVPIDETFCVVIDRESAPANFIEVDLMDLGGPQ